MPKVALSRRERALVAVALLAAIAIAGYLYVVEPIRQRNAQEAELIPVREARLERRRALIAQHSALTGELADADKRVAAESLRLLQGPTPPLAASELQKLIKDLAATVGVEVRSERVLPTVDRSGLVEVPIEITVAGGIRESVNLLGRIDQTPKLLTVQDFKMRVVSLGQPRDLLTTITVAGYLLGTPAPARTGEQGKAGGSRG
jgi:Tfp pilus assembly protein PilO